MKKLIIDNNCYADNLSPQIKSENLKQFPRIKKLSAGVDLISIGDLHGSAIKFLYFLIKYGIVRCSKMSYDILYRAYIENDIQKFCKTLKIHVKRPFSLVTPLVLLIGDTLSDRGVNDYMTLKIYMLLEDFEVEFKIILSNHDLEFIINYKKGLLKKTGKPEKFHVGGGPVDENRYICSMVNMHRGILEGSVNPMMVRHIVEKIYFPNLLVAYCFVMDINQKGSKLLVFSHAQISLSALRDCLAPVGSERSKKFIRYFDGNSIIDTINELNNNFNIDRFIHQSNRSLYSSNNSKHPIVDLVWQRDTRIDKMKPGHGVKFIHGHVGRKKPVKPNFFNLDSDFGKRVDYQDAMPVAIVETVENKKPVIPRERQVRRKPLELDYSFGKNVEEEDPIPEVQIEIRANKNPVISRERHLKRKPLELDYSFGKNVEKQDPIPEAKIETGTGKKPRFFKKKSVKKKKTNSCNSCLGFLR